MSEAGFRITEAIKAEAEALGVKPGGDIREIAKRVKVAKRKSEYVALGIPSDAGERIMEIVERLNADAAHE